MKFLSSSLPCAQIMKMSSMYLKFQVCGVVVFLCSWLGIESTNRFANVGANFVPMAVPHFYLYIMHAYPSLVHPLFPREYQVHS